MNTTDTGRLFHIGLFVATNADVLVLFLAMEPAKSHSPTKEYVKYQRCAHGQRIEDRNPHGAY